MASLQGCVAQLLVASIEHGGSLEEGRVLSFLLVLERARDTPHNVHHFVSRYASRVVARRTFLFVLDRYIDYIAFLLATPV